MSLSLHLCLYRILFASSSTTLYSSGRVSTVQTNDLHPILDQVGSTTRQVSKSRSPLSAVAYLHRFACQVYLRSTR